MITGREEGLGRDERHNIAIPKGARFSIFSV